MIRGRVQAYFLQAEVFSYELIVLGSEQSQVSSEESSRESSLKLLKEPRK